MCIFKNEVLRVKWLEKFHLFACLPFCFRCCFLLPLISHPAYLKDLSEYIFFFKETTISIIDILYAIGNFRLEQNFVNNELFPRLDRVMLYFFKFEFILQTIDFLDKNRKLFASIAFLNPGIFLYIKENTLKQINIILEFLQAKNGQINTKNPIYQRLLTFPYVNSSYLQLENKPNNSSKVEEV